MAFLDKNAIPYKGPPSHELQRIDRLAPSFDSNLSVEELVLTVERARNESNPPNLDEVAEEEQSESEMSENKGSSKSKADTYDERDSRPRKKKGL